MSSHKSQHFVPRCHLKPFSLNGEGRAINLYNIQRRSSISNAPIKKQCARSYFYGKDLILEKSFQKIEGLYAQTLRNIRAQNYVITVEDAIFFRRFWLLQHVRTEESAKRSIDMMSSIADLMPGTEEVAKRLINNQNVLRIAIEIYNNHGSTIDDLKVCFIRNKSSELFITSDNPAVMTNRLYSQKSAPRELGYGISNAGALFLLPLCPEILCVIYDGDVYSLPNNQGWASVNRATDADAFNQHQFLNCSANIYFADWAKRDQVQAAAERASPRRPASLHVAAIAELVEETDLGAKFLISDQNNITNPTQSLITTRRIFPEPTHWPSIIKFRPDRKIYSNGSSTGFSRRQFAVPNLGYRRIY